MAAEVGGRALASPAAAGGLGDAPCSPRTRHRPGPVLSEQRIDGHAAPPTCLPQVDTAAAEVASKLEVSGEKAGPGGGGRVADDSDLVRYRKLKALVAELQDLQVGTTGHRISFVGCAAFDPDLL